MIRSSDEENSGGDDEVNSGPKFHDKVVKLILASGNPIRSDMLAVWALVDLLGLDLSLLVRAAVAKELGWSVKRLQQAQAGLLKLAQEKGLGL